MYLSDLAQAIDASVVPGNCEAVREALHLRDRFDAKLAPAIDELAHSGEWEVEGAVTMLSWLRQNGAMTAGAAKTLTTTAARLAALPVTAAAYESGQLSTGQVRAIVVNVAERHVELFASHEADLVPLLADLSVAQLAQAMDEWRQRADALDDNPQPTELHRELFFSKTFESIRELKGSFAVESGEVIERGLALAATKDADTEKRRPAQRRADALIAVFQFYLDNHEISTNPKRHRPHVNVVVDVHDDVAGRYISGDIAPGDLIETLLCDCNVHRVLKNGRSAVLDYGRSARTAPPDLFNAIALRDGHCREPGCDRPPSWCDAHHVVMWEDQGPTRYENMVLRCTRHHHQWHKRRKLGWTERLRSDGTLEIFDPNGRRYESRPDGPLAPKQLAAV